MCIYFLLIRSGTSHTYTHTHTRCHFFFETMSRYVGKKMKEIRINNMIFQEIRTLATLSDRVARFVRHCKVVIFVRTRL